MKLPLRRLQLTVQSALSCCAIACITLFAPQANAQQIRADDTITVPTTVSTGNNQDFTINGGTPLGNSLFHSFDRFSVPTQGSAIFNNPASIANIISRVTGTEGSNINGLIKVNGTDTNLFLLNRNGITFGPDAQLDIGGSFVASTAESLTFANGAAFVTDTTALDPLLSISTPIGLQLGSASGAIKIEDSGYTLLPGITFPNIMLDSSASLRANAGQTLALVGNGITFEGGVVATPGGHIELGSVREGLVTFESIDGVLGGSFDYSGVQQFSAMDFSARSLIDTSSLLFDATGTPYAFGAQGGSIQLQGEHLTFREASRALIQNYGASASGNLRATATDTLELVGEFSTGERGSSLATMSYGSGSGGNVDITSPRLLLIGDTSIGTDTFTTGIGGDVTIKATETIRFESNQEAMPDFGQINANSFGNSTSGTITISTGDLVILGDGISSQSLGAGAGGLVSVEAERITLASGGNIGASTLFAGQGGDVTVTADTIDIQGINPRSFIPSTITAPTTGAGNAGNVTVNARKISLSEGGRIDSSALAAGNSGVVNVTALESLTVEGTVPGTEIPSLIISSANIASDEIRGFFATIGVILPAVPSGTSGNVIIKAPNVAITNDAQITVRNDGTGDAGTLIVNAGSVYLSDRAGMTASTQQGNGGNIVINSQAALLLRRGSRLSAEAGGAGDGGNITLTVPVVIALENSDITASAIQGTGGTIKINASAILGTEFRDQLTPESDITASSEFGVSGEVEINSIESDPSSGTIALPANTTDPNDQVVAGCSDTSASQFVATGRGGLPPNPTNVLSSNRLWSDTRASVFSASASLSASLSESTGARIDSETLPSETLPKEASRWIVNEQGQVSLLESLSSHSVSELSSPTCLKDDMANS